MKVYIKELGLAVLSLSIISCNNSEKGQPLMNDMVKEEPKTLAKEESKPLVEDVLSKEQQDALTPAAVITALKDGNERFINNDLTARDHSKQVRNSVLAQYPKAIVLSCVDSRVPVEDVFDRGIGDLFVARVAGNFVNEDILGSMEFACKVSGSKLILVLGHEHCGAVKAAVDNVQLGNITEMLKKIRPAVEEIKYEGDRTSKNKDFVDMACNANIKHAIEDIRAKSAVLKEMEEKEEIKIVGAVYDMDTGKVNWLDE